MGMDMPHPGGVIMVITIMLLIGHVDLG